MNLYHRCLLATLTIMRLHDCSASQVLFHKDLAYDDLMCHPDKVEFQETSENVVSCSRTCGDTPGCQSLIYLGENTTCIGINSSDPFTASTPLPGAMFYRLGGSNPQITTPGTTPGTTGVMPVGTTTTPSTTASTSTTSTTTASAPPTSTTTTTTTTPATTTTTAITTTTAPAAPLLGSVHDSQFDCSSEYDPNYTAYKARLDNTGSCWTPIQGSQNQQQWVQVDFVSYQVSVTGVITSGDPQYSNWVTSYKVLTSVDCSGFATIQDGTGNDVIFSGNSDQTTEVTNTISPTVTCRCFRINPWTWSGNYISIRFDVIGSAV